MNALTLPTGLKIRKYEDGFITPGIWAGVPSATYHGPLTEKFSISNSGLKVVFDDSPAHFYEKSYLNPANWEEIDGGRVLIEQPASEPLIFGRAAHHLLLGEADFRKHFVIRPETYPDDDTKAWSGNSKSCKAWLAEAKRQRLTVLTMNQIEHIKGMAASLAREPLIRAGILGGLIEHTMVSEDPETGINTKCRPDAIPLDSGDMADLKTAADLSDDGIQRAIGDNNLHMQGALVRRVWRALTGQEMTAFTLVFVEKAPPYCVRIHTLSDMDLDLGEEQIRISLRTVANCLETGRWWGPGGEQVDASTVSMTPWRRKAIERRIEIMTGDLGL